MTNELIFLLHVSLVSLAALLFGRIGKEALVAYISLLFVIANIFVLKQINFLGLCATSADAFILGVSFGLNILQEYYGRAYAQKTIWISFAISAFYMLATQCILLYNPAACDYAQPHLIALLSNTGRIIIASFIAYLITQMTDTYIYAYLRHKTNNQYFVLRNYISICFSQLLDTVLFTFLGLYGIIDNLISIMFVSYAIKIIALICTTPFLIVAKKIVKKENPTI